MECELVLAVRRNCEVTRYPAPQGRFVDQRGGDEPWPRMMTPWSVSVDPGAVRSGKRFIGQVEQAVPVRSASFTKSMLVSKANERIVMHQNRPLFTSEPPAIDKT